MWGPFRLRPGTDGADEHGRTARQEGQAVTDSWLLTIERPPNTHAQGGSPINPTHTAIAFCWAVAILASDCVMSTSPSLFISSA